MYLRSGLKLTDTLLGGTSQTVADDRDCMIKPGLHIVRKTEEYPCAMLQGGF